MIDDWPTAAELEYLRRVWGEAVELAGAKRECKRPLPELVRFRPGEVRHLRTAYAEAVELTAPARTARVVQRGAIGAARFHAASSNRKLGPVDLVQFPGQPRPRPMPRAPFVSSTYASIESTCPDSCAFKRSGCFADSGFTKMASGLMDQASRGHSATAVIEEEARLVRRSFSGKAVPRDGGRHADRGRDLRYHVGGDVGSLGGAVVLGQAAENWRGRGGGAVWTFTHWWRGIDRRAWGPAVSVLASVEDPRDFAAARAKGYAPAIVVNEFQSSSGWREEGLRVIPCPAETRPGTTCAQCRLCLDRDLVKMDAAIAFAVHGTGARAAKEKLAQIRRVR